MELPFAWAASLIQEMPPAWMPPQPPPTGLNGTVYGLLPERFVPSYRAASWSYLRSKQIREEHERACNGVERDCRASAAATYRYSHRAELLWNCLVEELRDFYGIPHHSTVGIRAEGVVAFPNSTVIMVQLCPREEFDEEYINVDDPDLTKN